MPVMTEKSELAALLADRANQLRIDSIRATSEAGSGHPTSCASAAEIVSTLFFSVMRYDPSNPRHPGNDVCILSKGHAAPVLYAAWAEAGLFPREDLLALRQLTSDLEGHPTPRLPFVDVATGSLGQGLSVGVGMALHTKYVDPNPRRIYVLLGDAEAAEGAVWEATEIASYYKLDNLCAVVDVNRLGQSQPTMLEHDLKTYQARWRAFGWQTAVVDGHNVTELLQAFRRAARAKDRPSMILARTLKGKGIPIAEDREGWHGKALAKEDAESAIRAMEAAMTGTPGNWRPRKPKAVPALPAAPPAVLPDPPYSPGDSVAPREAFGAAVAALGDVDPRVVVLDGDVKNSTYTEKFQNKHPSRFFQGFIAEQNGVGAAMGFGVRGKIPFYATFACFLSRAADFIRIAAISGVNLKLAGTHAGVSIGEDGPTQMGLEDLAMFCAEPNFTVLYPSDGVSAWRATETAAALDGLVYLRLGRPKSPVLYGASEKFEVGRAKVLRRSEQDRVTIVAGGVTLFEALTAHESLAQEGIPVRVIDLYSVQPIDQETLRDAARATGGRVITVEDHYAHGGLGDAVLAALATERVEVHKMAVREIPRSGAPEQLLRHYGISAEAIVAKTKEIAG